MSYGKVIIFVYFNFKFQHRRHDILAYVGVRNFVGICLNQVYQNGPDDAVDAWDATTPRWGMVTLLRSLADNLVERTEPDKVGPSKRSMAKLAMMVRDAKDGDALNDLLKKVTPLKRVPAYDEAVRKARAQGKKSVQFKGYKKLSAVDNPAGFDGFTRDFYYDSKADTKLWNEKRSLAAEMWLGNNPACKSRFHKRAELVTHILLKHRRDLNAATRAEAREIANKLSLQKVRIKNKVPRIKEAEDLSGSDDEADEVPVVSQPARKRLRGGRSNREDDDGAGPSGAV